MKFHLTLQTFMALLPFIGTVAIYKSLLIDIYIKLTD